MLDWWIGLTVVPVYQAYRGFSRAVESLVLATGSWPTAVALLLGAVMLCLLATYSLRLASASNTARWLLGALLRLCAAAAVCWFVAYSTLTGVLAVWRGPFEQWIAAGWPGWVAAILLIAGGVLWILVALRMLGIAVRTLRAIGAPVALSRRRATHDA